MAFFHLIVGFMIHSSGGAQDGRQMSSFGLSSPMLGVMLGTTNLALCGFPFLSGFYSKDSMLEQMHVSSMNLSFVGLIMAGAGLTVAYSFRVLYLSVAGVSVTSSVSGLSDFNFIVVKSVVILFSASLFSGFLMYWAVMPLEAPSYLSDQQKYATVLVSLMGGVGVYSALQMKGMMNIKVFKVIETTVSNMWFLSQLNTKFPVTGFMSTGVNCTKLIDLGWFEYYGGQGGRSLMFKTSEVLQKSQGSSKVKSFMITVFLSLAFLLLMV